ncbi:MAG: Crp/Fnr family transcriptional regulator [Proteobacteria bacterium]|jgi:CRP-like cAMP-binding protein|nr:Crp/Fnr family transcriptional regulator [Pseudomonadota bacterium]
MSDPLFAKYGKNAKAGEVLFTTGEKGAEMFVVRSGSVRIAVESRGVEKTLAILGPGEFVGEMSILTDQPRSATATVQEDAELLVVGVRVLEEMIVHNTEIALRLIRKLARRLESADALIRVLLYRDAKERVIENLKRLVRIHDNREGAVRFRTDFNEMAEQVGLEPAEVEDIMLRLVNAGFVALEDGTWVISKVEDIDDFLQFLKLKDQYK